MSDSNSNHEDRGRKGGLPRVKRSIKNVPWMEMFRISVELTLGILQCLG